jgi:putative oxidoreductase
VGAFSLLRLSLVGQHLGRIGLASLFVLAGINKLMQYAPTAQRMSEVGLAPVALLLPLTIMLELLGGLAVMLRLPGSSAAAITLAIFTLATNWFFHPFWRMDTSVRAVELSLFFKNVTIAGALLYYAGTDYARRAALAVK